MRQPALHGHLPRIFRAPGRVNLIGDHTDYNDGFVMPAAIEFAARVAVAPRDDRQVHCYTRQFEESTAFELDDPNARARGHWSDYVRGVVVMLQAAGHRLRGASLTLDSDVPIGAGLSSSAAIEVATALALQANSGVTLDLTEVALLCQRAENQFVGARSGIMDQFISCFGRKDHAMRLDCRSLERRYLPIPGSVKLVVCDTTVKHALASNEYNLRRAQCENGVRALSALAPGIRALRDVTLAFLAASEGALDPLGYKRCRHVITENERVLAATRALERSDLGRFGQLMVESHRSLADDFEVSSPELDVMVNLALKIEGTLGARMTGGGFGGCTINLVKAENARLFARTIADRYEAETGHKGVVHICAAQDGASEERQ